MSLNNPITKPSQMQRPLVCRKSLGESWNSDRSQNVWWAVGEKLENHAAHEVELAKMKKMIVLRDKILSFGGSEVCLPIIEDDYDIIMNRGQLIYGTGIKYRKGQPCQCHSNAAYLWDANRGRCQIMTGYALSEDSMWRQHTWVVQPLATKWRVWETTVGRVAYFGAILNDDECEEFLRNQW